MAGYTKEFLLEAFAMRYVSLGMAAVDSQYALAENHYDKVGKDQFRIAASLDAQAIREFKARPKMTWSQAIEKLTCLDRTKVL